MERQPEYPPEYDVSDPCEICDVDTDRCACVDCDVCGVPCEPACIMEHNLEPACMIKSIWDLARHLEAPDTGTAADVERSVAASLFKAGGGISFRSIYPHKAEEQATKPPHGADAVALSAYAEGVDVTLSEDVLEFPFTPHLFNETVRAKEFETDSVWEQTHGCDACPDSKAYHGYKSIDHNCASCNGDGTIL